MNFNKYIIRHIIFYFDNKVYFLIVLDLLRDWPLVLFNLEPSSLTQRLSNFVYVCGGGGIKSRTLLMVGKHYTTELHPNSM
jgi:hypothetical protein